MHKDFYEIVGRLETRTDMDLLTNLNVNVKEFMHHVNPKAFDRDAKYASIRVSYHHGQHSFNKLLEKVMLFKKHNYNIGIWEVEHPEYRQDVLKRQSIAQTLGVDYRIKEFLGPYKGDNYGSMHYGMAVNDKHLRSCLCRTNELLIGPSGDIYRCHADLYSGFNPIGNIMDARIPELGKWRECGRYGRCNSCDIKIKTNRFQEFGYTSVEITNVGPAYKDNEVLDNVVNTYRKDIPTSSD